MASVIQKVSSVEDLDRIAQGGREALQLAKPRLIFGFGTCGIASGARALRDYAVELLDKKAFEAQITAVGCIGMCHAEPLVDVQLPDRPRVTYAGVKKDALERIIDEHLICGRPIVHSALAQLAEELSVNNEFAPTASSFRYEGIPQYRELPFMSKQLRIVLRNCGIIDPDSIEQYIARGGYRAACKALQQMSPEDVIRAIEISGLRGRGGGGFPTALKWSAVRKAKGEPKYIICNADEGDPGAYMNRAVLEGDPHSVLEGMLIGAYAMGASEGYIYVRAEYPLAVEALRKAISQSEALGILGKNAFGTSFSFRLQLMEGAGAFVCGEETALIASIEGRRGEPHQKPPFPAEKGLFGKPTAVNNVETWNTAAIILQKGGPWFAGIGSDKSTGTKVFSLVGKIQRPGLVEIPLGTSLKEIIYDIGGGMQNNRRFKAVQTGGPSGGCIPAEMLDIGVTYENLKAAGSILGSGGMVAMDEDTCMVDVARYFLGFTSEESCGQCTPCRVGLRRMLALLDKISYGTASAGDVATLEYLAGQIRDAALCGLGQSAPNPVLTTLRYFRNEFEKHIKYRRCDASVCPSLFDAPCENSCPAGTKIPGYIQLIAEGKLQEAYELNLEDNPFPSVCGRVCEHPCELRCQRALFDDPIAIRELKRFCSDSTLGSNSSYVPQVTQLRPRNKFVAVVGGGPSGLSAAFFLKRLGYSVTIYESTGDLGGMMRWAIPRYRLAYHILDREIQNIINLGVLVKLNCKVGWDVKLPELANRYDAVYLAVGVPHDQKLGLEGEELPGIEHGLKLLREINSGRRPKLGKRVLIIGGGNVAVDIARSVNRLDCEKVVICYRREQSDMPAYGEEVEQAEAEGIEFHFLLAPESIIVESNRAVGMRFRKMLMGAFDKGGRRTPQPTDEVVEFRADTIVTAVGQSTEPGLTAGLKEELINKRGLISADPGSQATANPNIFAGGDAVIGPATVIEAVAQGKRAARAIDIQLSGSDRFPELKEKRSYRYSMEAPVNAFVMKREKPPEILLSERHKNFEEVVLSFEPDRAQREAHRCFRCDIMSKEINE